jgi:hypothetical protein
MRCLTLESFLPSFRALQEQEAQIYDDQAIDRLIVEDEHSFDFLRNESEHVSNSIKTIPL